MKKNLFILAATAAALASCSNDVTTAVNTTLNAPQEITFRSTMDGMTRAVATNTSTIESNGFTAEGWMNSSHSSHFAATTFTKSGTSYVAASKPQWPATGNLDFVAWYPALEENIFSHAAWNTFTFVPNTTVASQKDYVIAAVLNQAKTNSGVPLVFKHLGSWIEVKVYNSKGNTTNNYKTTVTGWKLGYLYNGGVYTITGSTADASALSATGSWNYTNYAQATSNVPFSYSETFDAVTISNDGAHDASGNAIAIGNAMIVVPQTTIKLTSSSTYGTGGYLTGAFIAIKLLVEDAANGDADIADATSDNLWAVWPVNNDWADGTKYTYIIDLAQGGYKETGTASETIKPWIENTEIFFNSVNVSTWTEGSPAVVTP